MSKLRPHGELAELLIFTAIIAACIALILVGKHLTDWRVLDPH